VARRKPPTVNGLVVVDKPAGMTSHDVVAMARRQLNERRIGHSGTLDPDATGVLLLGVGHVTRLLRFLTALGKTYTAEIVLGSSTSTLDASGEVTGVFDMARVTSDDVRRAASMLTGDIQQIPPMVSAVQIDGVRLHELARQGIEVDRAARSVTVHAFDVEPTDDATVYRCTVHCSSGTYVRTLADDLGRLLGGGAHLRALRRTAIGSFTVDHAVALDALDRTALLDPVTAMRDYSTVHVDANVAVQIGHGVMLDRDAQWTGEGPWVIVGPNGELLAMYEATGDRVKPAVVVPTPD
jgi:tRNA pseudouridine55 synthase